MLYYILFEDISNQYLDKKLCAKSAYLMHEEKTPRLNSWVQAVGPIWANMEMTQKYWLQYLVLLATSWSSRPTRYFRMSTAFGSAVFTLGTAEFRLEAAAVPAED